MANFSFVWVFNGEKGNLPSAIFSKRELAEEWIKRHRLTGVLTAYPLDISVYDWAISNGFFTPKRENHFSAEFISGFSSASQEHYHYENGNCE
jgi:hypothetical protein